MHNTPYDFVIIGSGLGGLACAYLLTSVGYSVCVLEKNHQIGGTLQVFSRDKAILDTGVHYIGSLNPGETVYKLFKHFGILEELKLQKLDEQGFDVVELSDGFQFSYPQGSLNFKSKLLETFPEEVLTIEKYIAMLEEVSHDFPLYELKDDPYSGKVHWHMEIATSTYIDALTSNQRLRDVLTGTNAFLYAGQKEVTPLHVHALVQNSYLKGAYRLIDGGSQIAIALSRKIRAQGGVIRKRCEVVHTVYASNEQSCQAVVLASGEKVYGNHFISNLHPLPTMDIFGQEHFLKPFRKRIQQLPNTLSCFMVHLVFKENSFPYLNYNLYKHHNTNVWAGAEYKEVTWPEQYFISTPTTSRNKEFAESMSIMCYMRYEEVKEWEHTFNTRTTPNQRTIKYESFKKEKETQVVNRLASLFPMIKEQIFSIYSCTPLTWRDYLHTPEGSMYGIIKDAQQPLKSMVNAKTHIPNLYLTGQNLIMHGILGVCIGALVTCSHFIDRKKLLAQIALSNQV